MIRDLKSGRPPFCITAASSFAERKVCTRRVKGEQVGDYLTQDSVVFDNKTREDPSTKESGLVAAVSRIARPLPDPQRNVHKAYSSLKRLPGAHASASFR